MNEKQSVQITVTLDKTDIKRYITYYYRRSIFLQLVSFIAAVLLFAFLVNILIPDSTISFLTGLDPLIIAFLLIILLLPFFIYFLLLRSAKKYGLFEERIYSISKQEVKIKTEANSISFPVSSLVRVAETKNTIYLWQQKTPQILPKRFMSETDIEFLRSLLADN